MPVQIKQHPKKEGYFQLERAVLSYEDFKKEKPELSEYFQKYSCPIAVLGAGPSLPEDMKKLPNERLEVSCNHHAFRLTRPDYMVFLDNPEDNHSSEFRKRVKNPECIRVSYKILQHTDIYTINEFPEILNPLGDTGMFGCWFACYITSGPVYLCGMDVNRNGVEHFYEAKEQASWGGSHYTVKLRKWKQVFDYCEKPERIEVMSGPLKEVLCNIVE